MYVLCTVAPHIKKSPKIYELDERTGICPVCGKRVDSPVTRVLGVIYRNSFSHEGGHIVSDDVEYLMEKKRQIFNLYLSAL